MADVASPPMSPASAVGSDVSWHNDKKVEQLLSEKLLEGYELVDSACPTCVTPLVKKKPLSMNFSPKSLQPVTKSKGTSPHMSISYQHVHPQPSTSFVVASESFETPFSPVSGVPYCVLCEAHVVTHHSDMKALDRCGILKNQGRVIVAIEEKERESTLATDRYYESRMDHHNHYDDEQSPEDDDARDEAEMNDPMLDEPVEQLVVLGRSRTQTMFEGEEGVELSVVVKKPIAENPAFMYGSNAAVKQISPLPIHSVVSQYSEEGIEHQLSDHESNLLDLRLAAANSAYLPPTPVDNDSLEDSENEEFDNERAAMFKTLTVKTNMLEEDQVSRSVEAPTKSDVAEMGDDIVEEYSIR